jgi:hypothetical protein
MTAVLGAGPAADEVSAGIGLAGRRTCRGVSLACLRESNPIRRSDFSGGMGRW